MYSYLILYPNRSRAAGGGGKSPPGPGRYHGYSKPVLLRDSAHPDNEHIDNFPTMLMICSGSNHARLIANQHHFCRYRSARRAG